ncbi:SPFH domain-containing protein [Streptomyces sp. NPDC012794]|uniref:SPFH domain-containing protein n=1 Tax=Streptomyces sp. NPDC012794 TaxID=3364850 RepID=UPI003673796F
MYPTHTTFTTGTFRIPALPAAPAGATAHASGPAGPLPSRAPAVDQDPAAGTRPAEPVAVYRGSWTPQPPAAGPVPLPAPGPAPAVPPAPTPAPTPAAHPAPAPVWPSAQPAPAAAHPAGPEPQAQPPAGESAAPDPHPWAAAPAAPARAAVPQPGGYRDRPAGQPGHGPTARAAHPDGPAPERAVQPFGATRFASGVAALRPAGPEPVTAVPAAEPTSATGGTEFPAAAATCTPAPRAAEPAAATAPRAAEPDPLPAGHAHPEPAPLALAAPPATAPDPAPGAFPGPTQGRASEPEPARPGPSHPADADADPDAFRAAADAPEPGSEPARPGPPRGDVPAARSQAGADAAPGIPHPAPEPPHGVPGPGPAEIAARAVARGMRTEDPAPRGRPRPSRGGAVTEVPLHLPFRPQPQPPRSPAAAPVAITARKPVAGRRVPRGDDRLREHRGPVLPGWIAVAVGGLALLGCAAVLWRAGVVPATVVAAFGAPPRPYQGLRATHWPPLAFLGIVTLLALGGLGRAKAGHAWVLTLFGRYRGTVRRTGLTWISPLLLRQRVDVRLRHWRSEPMPAVDSGGLALQVVVQVVWQVKDTARATLAVEDHTDYLAEQVESAMARVLSQLPADAFHEDAPTLRDAEAVGDALTRMVAAETEAVGIEVFSAQPTRIEYAPEVAEAMRRRRVAAIDAKHRDTVLTSVVDAVDDTVHRLTSRGIVELDDYERKALVKDLTVAFYTGRSDQ